jgi:hypothetical protein
MTSRTSAIADDNTRRTAMTDKPKHETRWRLLRDVLVFQIKLGMEALLDLTLIPVSLAAAAGELATATMVPCRVAVRRELRTQDRPVGRPDIQPRGASIRRRCAHAQHRDPAP